MLTVRRTKSKRDIMYVLTRLWDEISFGEVEYEDYEPDLDWYWLEIKRDGELLGVYSFHEHAPGVLVGHANILPEHRRQYTDLITKGVSKWLKANLPEGFTKLMVQIPLNRPNVLKYAFDIGFEEERKVLGIPLEKFYSIGEL